MSDGAVGDVFEGDGGFHTCDLYLAAFFISLGCKMIKPERDNRNHRVNFVFEKNPMMNEMKVKYFSRDGKVDALTFADNVKSLKSLCHNVLSSPPQTR